MTPHALLVLSLALVCSLTGFTSGQTSDRAGRHTTHTHAHTHTPDTMKTRTNHTHIHKYVHNVRHNEEDRSSKYDNFNSKRKLASDYAGFDKAINNLRKVDNGKVYDELFIDNESNVHSEEVIHLKNDGKVSSNGAKHIQSDVSRGIKKSQLKRDEIHDTKYSTNERYNDNVKFVPEEDNRNGAGSPKITETKYITFGKGKTRIFDTNKASNGNARYWSPFAKSNKNSRVKRQDLALIEENICDKFTYDDKKTKLQHPHNTTSKENNYYSKVECTTVIQAAEGQVIKLTFVDVFHIEEHPNCMYDYLEIRDGKYGYAKSLGRYCGSVFPSPLSSSGPFLWLKFQSDETIEYEGFTIKIEFVNAGAVSHSIPDSCYMKLSGVSGVLGTNTIDQTCKDRSAGHALDVLWTIETDSDKYLYLNFTSYELAQPNECEMNLIQVFGAILEEEKEFAHYCGSVANLVNTKNSDSKQQEQGNIMYVHLLVATTAIDGTKFSATFTAFRALDPSKDEQCLSEDVEFNCEDNTCIAAELRCDGYAHCRLKADEDACEHHTESTLSQPHILVILVIFSLILSSMSFVFLFKCIRKLYQDHKIIKEHIRQSCEDRLDDLGDSRFTLDAKRLQRDSEPRASLERENHTNELFKQQRSISQHKQTSIESEFQETHIDLDEEPWRREVDSLPEPQDLKLERNGRARRDTIKKQETLRSRKESVEEKKEIKDVAVGAPDTKESGCQTRESLFQADTAPSSDGSTSASNSRGFSTFGYSGATLARPSPPAAAPPPAAPAPALAAKFCSTQIELLMQIPSYETKKKIPDRRPMSAETTRSAPDVIIVSKPIR